MSAFVFHPVTSLAPLPPLQNSDSLFAATLNVFCQHPGGCDNTPGRDEHRMSLLVSTVCFPTSNFMIDTSISVFVWMLH